MRIDNILKTSKNIAIVGLSPDESKASNIVAKFLIKEGFNIFPIYPKEDEILGRKVYRSLSEIDKKIDIAVMFRKGEFAENLIMEVINLGIKTLWLQLGITNKNAKIIAKENNINFVEDKCIKIELERFKNDIVK
ncbi:CoA-binding protein [Campylobacter sp. RM16190]|uniref:CoA-binding protein n=1 Tax=Campylobacter sp. RM16190 TaxID=1705727 RepID=UPI001474A44B|nr:CoA-binding protein [Campylobacter sp. RM16190]